MDPEEQRIAIAEACGWTHSIGDFGGDYWRHETRGPCLPPDYLNDLNAMHEAECSLSNTKHKVFRMRLNLVTHKTKKYIHPKRVMVSATAAQRAEAFLKALDLWIV